MDIIKRNSVANIINNDNNTKTKCCVTEDIDHDKITAIYLTNQSIRSVQTFGKTYSNISRNTDSCSSIINMNNTKRKALGSGVGSRYYRKEE